MTDAATTAASSERPATGATGNVSLRAFFLRFALAFMVLEAFVYLVLWHARWFTPYAELNAWLTAVLVRPWMEVRAVGAYLVSPAFSILVRPGCDGYQASAVLVAGVLAMPASSKQKWIGVALGVGALMALNLLRLAVLLWTGIHHGEHFEVVHIQVLPGLFAAASLFLLLGWAHWARRPAAR
jgi:exosortase/archaeosortase family protein